MKQPTQILVVMLSVSSGWGAGFAEQESQPVPPAKRCRTSRPSCHRPRLLLARRS